jgi:LacI family transcriptional regulator, galactose operon repressor
MAATITQIAQAAGVSAGTVSRVLNGKGDSVRPAAARRAEEIRRIAKEYGYLPNLAARNIRSGRFGSVAFLSCSDIGADVFELPVLHGIQSALAPLRLRLTMCELSKVAFESPATIPHVFKESSVDGLLIDYLFDVPGRATELIRSSHVPVVWLNRKRELNAVYPDDFAGGHMAARYLISMGHKKLAFASYHETDGFNHYSVLDRSDGFSAALFEAGLKPVANEITDGFTMGRAPERAMRLLSQPDRPTAVVCYEKHEAVAVWVAAVALGIKIPQELSILAFNTDRLRNQTGLPITTAIVPLAEVGRQAVAMLQEAIEVGDAEQPARPIPYSLDESMSCAPPPK